jgi:hypothetical protein
LSRYSAAPVLHWRHFCDAAAIPPKPFLLRGGVTRQQQVVRPQLSEEEKKKKVKELQVQSLPPAFPPRHEIISKKANY